MEKGFRTNMINYNGYDEIEKWLDEFEWDAIIADFNFDSGILNLKLRALDPKAVQEQAALDLIALGEGPSCDDSLEWDGEKWKEKE